MSDSNEIFALAKRFFDYIERGDIAAMVACYASDAKIWHNTDDTEQTPADNGAALSGFVKRIADRKYGERRVHAFPGGFVQQHVLTGVRKDGVKLTLPACIICQVKDGKIARLDEYFDSAHVAKFRETV